MNNRRDDLTKILYELLTPPELTPVSTSCPECAAKDRTIEELDRDTDSYRHMYIEKTREYSKMVLRIKDLEREVAAKEAAIAGVRKWEEDYGDGLPPHIAAELLEVLPRSDSQVVCVVNSEWQCLDQKSKDASRDKIPDRKGWPAKFPVTVITVKRKD